MRALAFAMALTTLLGEPTPADLVALLNSSDRIEREEAARTLEELGAEALPALRSVSPAAPEQVRARALSVARIIEGRLIDRPSMVPVDFDGQTLDEAVRALAARSGFTLKLEVGSDAALPLRSIRVRSSAPIPFWEALDLIGKAGQIRHDPGFKVWDANPSPVLHLVAGTPPTSTMYRGPFRIHLLSLHRRRDVNLSLERGRTPVSSNSLYAEVQAIVEPNRFVEMNGAPRVEAVDDRGRTLPPPSIDSLQPPQSSNGWNVPGAIGLLQWRLPLGSPAEDASSLRSLSGTLPIMISSRRPDPLLIRLDEAPGQPHRFEDMTLKFQDIQNTQGQFQMELVIKPDQARGPARSGRNSDALRQQLVFEDREDHPLTWLMLNEIIGPGGEKKVRVMLSGPQPPVRLRYFGLVRIPVEIPFEFTNILLP
jgi:hypothetical protein